MRTQHEILARIEYLDTNDLDIFGFQSSDLIDVLSFKKQKNFSKKE